VPGSLVGGRDSSRGLNPEKGLLMMVARRAVRAIHNASVLRSDRFSAVLLLSAAVLALVLANLPFGQSVLDLKDTHLAIPLLGLDLSVGHWIQDGLLAVFFFVVAVELKHELTIGQLSSFGKAVVPAIGAIGGVAVPALVYLAIAGSTAPQGWPIPTATDIAFALGVFAVFGKGLPSTLRIYLLALAVLDDLMAIVIIALFFTTDVNVGALALGAAAIAAFGVLSAVMVKISGGPKLAVGALMLLLALVAWFFVYESGVHATIAGVGLGLVMVRSVGHTAADVIQPYSNAIVLPLFALSAALVAIPQVAPSGITLALPFGKILGITLFGTIAYLVVRRKGMAALHGMDLVTVAAVAGIGFTVSLLMNELAFAQSQLIVAEGTLAVLLGSAIAMVIGGSLVALRSRYYRTHASAGEQQDVEQQLPSEH
jgi:NhaA family Na+:H+ antiporter